MDFVDELNMKASANSLRFFTEEVLKFDVKDFHNKWLTDLTTHHRNVIICSRDHGKSTLASLALPLWTTIHSPIINPTDVIDNNNTILISNSLDQSYELINRIQIKIEETEILQSINWSRGNKGEVSVNEKNNHNYIKSKSFGSSIRGLHPRFCTVDDPLSEKSSFSDQAILDFYFSSLSNMMQTTAYLNVVGTRFNYKDLYAVLSEPERGYNVATYPALDKDDNPLWPERYSYSDLMSKRREIGALPFAREFQCVPHDDSASIFPLALTQPCLNKQYTFETEGDGESRYLIAADFALGTTSSSDFSVITVLKDDREGNISIVDVWRETGKEYDIQIKAIKDRYERFNPVRIVVENNVFQAIFEQILKKERLPVVGVTTTRQSKENNAYLLRSLIEDGKIIFPYGDTKSREMMDEYLFELSMFSQKNGKLQGIGAHDDTVMSLTIGIKGMMDISGVVTDGKAGGFSSADNILDINFNMQNNKFNSPWSSDFINGLGIK